MKTTLCSLMLGLLLLQGCSTIVAIPKTSEFSQSGSPKSESTNVRVNQAVAISQWNAVLREYVNTKGEVDFSALAKNQAPLLSYLAFVEQTPFDTLTSPTQKLAHFINSYNALSMYNVIDLGIPQSNQALSSRYRFFFARKFVIGGQTMSLYTFENEIIRKLGDPRVHWALNCSAHSCPVLPKFAFSAQELEQQLDSEAKKFFANPANLRIDHERKEVWLSEIMSFFTEDFVPKHAANLIAYANRYAPQAAPEDYVVKFFPYDWTIANTSRADAR